MKGPFVLFFFAIMSRLIGSTPQELVLRYVDKQCSLADAGASVVLSPRATEIVDYLRGLRRDFDVLVSLPPDGLKYSAEVREIHASLRAHLGVAAYHPTSLETAPGFYFWREIESVESARKAGMQQRLAWLNSFSGSRPTDKNGVWFKAVISDLTQFDALFSIPASALPSLSRVKCLFLSSVPDGLAGDEDMLQHIKRLDLIARGILKSDPRGVYEETQALIMRSGVELESGLADLENLRDEAHFDGLVEVVRRSLQNMSRDDMQGYIGLALLFDAELFLPKQSEDGKVNAIIKVMLLRELAIKRGREGVRD